MLFWLFYFEETLPVAECKIFAKGGVTPNWPNFLPPHGLLCFFLAVVRFVFVVSFEDILVFLRQTRLRALRVSVGQTLLVHPNMRLPCRAEIGAPAAYDWRWSGPWESCCLCCGVWRCSAASVSLLSHSKPNLSCFVTDLTVMHLLQLLLTTVKS